MEKSNTLCMAEENCRCFEDKREFQAQQIICATTLRGAKAIASRMQKDKNSFIVLGYPTSNGIIYREDVVAVRNRRGGWIEYC